MKVPSETNTDYWRCDACGNDLGLVDPQYGQMWDWRFCPYCGERLGPAT